MGCCCCKYTEKARAKATATATEINIDDRKTINPLFNEEEESIVKPKLNRKSRQEYCDEATHDLQELDHYLSNNFL